MLRSPLVVAPIVLVAACTTTVEPTSKITVNGLDLASVGRHADELARLAAFPLEDNQAAATLAQTNDGRELLEYVTQCALDGSATLAVGGITLHGVLGIAQGWRGAPCDASCRRWVSACLIAHANVGDAHVPIQLRADHPALGDVVDGFTYQEAAFYGDVFGAAATTSDDDRIPMFACGGRSLVDRLGPTTVEVARSLQSRAARLIADYVRSEDLHDRLCSVGGCGIFAAGLCADYPSVGIAAACNHDGGATGTFGSCSDTIQTRESFSEVITVYLEE